MQIEESKEVLREQINSFKHYVEHKIKGNPETIDWHAVSDAANDIRELVAKLEVLNQVKQ